MFKSLRRRSTILVASGLASMLGSFFLLAAPAGAHEVRIGSSTAVICDESGLVLAWEASTWTFDSPAGLHPNIIVSMRTDVSDVEVIGGGAFTEENGRSLSGMADIPAGATELRLIVTPDPNEFWEGTDVVGNGNSTTLTVPLFAELCGDSPTNPTPTPTAVPAPPTPTAIPEPTPTPTAVPAPPTPTAEPTPTPTEPPISASLACTVDGVTVSVTAQTGEVYDVFVDGALSFSVTIPASGSATAEIEQQPGQTNDFEVRDGSTVLASATLSCVEGSSSPGQPTATPEVEGEVELPQTGAESGPLALAGGLLLAVGATMTMGGIALARRID